MKKKEVKKKRVNKNGKGNWALNTKNISRGLGSGAGRSKGIEYPEKLWQLFLQYEKWSKENPYKIHEGFYRGKNVYKLRERALTIVGFEGWLAGEEIIANIVDYRVNKEGRYTDYANIIAAIKSKCSQDTVTGAMAGSYNANIAARIEGLKENIDNTSGGEPIKSAPEIKVYNTAPPMAASEEEITKQLKK